jgi:hypothetical protein
MAAAMASMTNLAGGLMGGVGASMSLWAQEPIQVNGQPVGPLNLQLREGLTFAGSVVFEGTTLPPGAVRVSLGATTGNSGLPDVPMFRQNASIAQVTPAGTFELAGIAPGVYSLAVLAAGMRLVPTEPGTGWMVKSVRLGDRDLADDGVDMRPGSDLSGVVVTMTDRPSELSGRVLDAASEPFSAFPLVVFSANREHWGVGSRRVTAVQPSTDGSYVVAGLPAGRYYLAVLTEVDIRELASATLLESLIPSALSVTLADGERKTQDIRLAGGEPGSLVPRFLVPRF